MRNVKFKWHGDIAREIARKAAKQALGKCALDLKGKSSNRAPIDTGDLRADCDITSFKEEAGKIEIGVFYDLPYAIVQHERLDFKHPKGGEAKYLENPFNENKNQYEKFIKNSVKWALKRG